MSTTSTHSAVQDHASRLAAGQACLDAALHLYLPLGLAVTCCCDPEHIGVGPKHAQDCDSPGKAPIHAWKALQTQLPTADEVRRWWHHFPYGNVGAVLGQASGLVRVDVDGLKGEALLAAWSAGDLPPTWTFRSSPAGRGLLYTWPHDLPCKSTMKVSPGDHQELRLMGNGSQTVLPPSRHPSGSLYAWEPGRSPDDLPIAPAPAWLVKRSRAETQPTPHAAPPRGRPLDDDYARVASALRAIPNNDAPYDDWLTVGMALHSTGASWARELWDDWSRQSAKYNEGKQEKSWRSFTQDGKTTIGMLFHQAKQYGWRPPQPTFTVNGSRLAPDMTQTATTDANHRQNGPSAHPALITRCAADVTPEQVQWLWKPYIALGTICMLDGDPGIGKSLLTLQLAANISQGYPFPDQAGKPTVNAGEPQNVLIMTREDSLSKTIRPRLDASGADVSRVFVSANWLDAEGKEQAFTLKHLPLLEAELERLRPRLVVLDPIQSFFGDIDMHRANQTRPLLDALAALADTYRCAILCIRHPAKPGEGIGKALHRGLGSIDIIGAARTGLFIEQYPGDETRALMAQTKSNLGSKGRTQIFSKKEGVFAWERVTRLTDEDLAGSGRGPNHRTFLEALLWLEQRLEGGLAWNASDIEKEAEERDISSNVLKRAKKALGIVSAQLKGDAHLGWTWRLPPLSLPPTESSKVTESPESSESPDQKSKTYGDEKVCAPEERLSDSEDSEGSEGSEDLEDGVVIDGISASEALTSDRLSGGGESCPQCHCTSLLVLGEYRRCPLCLWKGKLSVSGHEEVSR